LGRGGRRRRWTGGGGAEGESCGTRDPVPPVHAHSHLHAILGLIPGGRAEDDSAALHGALDNQAVPRREEPHARRAAAEVRAVDAHLVAPRDGAARRL